MRISVALCTYNGALFLQELLASIAAQARLPDEVIACDDCSSDSTPAILADFARFAPFPVSVRVNQRNLGVTRNFEQAIQRCTGDVIALADQDDRWYPGKLAALEATFTAHPQAGLVFSDADVIDGGGASLGYTLWRSVRFDDAQQRAVRSGQAVSVLLKHPVVTGATLAFRSSLRDRLLPIAPDCVHDEWIALIAALSSEIIPVPERLMGYRRHSANQIGAEGVDLPARLRTALATDPAVYRKRAEQFRRLRDHIARLEPADGTMLNEFDGKIAHLEGRGSLPAFPPARIAPIAREVLNGHYRRYSGSLLNSLRDLLLRHR
jgi:glycosyltransferase involved in cell wall biosynthesis